MKVRRFWISVLLLSWPAVGRAQETDCLAAGITKANVGDLRGAIEAFAAAQKRPECKDPLLTYNLARTTEVLANKEKDGAAACDSVKHYRSFLEKGPGDLIAAAQRSLAAMKKRCADHEQRVAAEALPMPSPAPERDVSGDDGARRPTRSGRDLAPWGWVAIGVGAVAVAGGVVFTVAELRAHDDFDNAASVADQRAAKEDIGAYGMTNRVLYGVGGAAIVGGIVLLLLDDAGDAKTGVGV